MGNRRGGSPGADTVGYFAQGRRAARPGKGRGDDLQYLLLSFCQWLHAGSIAIKWHILSKDSHITSERQADIFVVVSREKSAGDGKQDS